MTVPIERSMPLVVTDVGRDHAIDVTDGGFDLILTHIAIGDGTVVPTAASTALGNEKLRVEVLSWSKPALATIEVQALVISSLPGFMATEIGVYAGDVLVALGYRPTGLVDVTNGIPYAFSAALTLIGLPEDTTVVVDAVLDYELAFIDPIAALSWVVGQNTQRIIDHELRLRKLEGKSNLGVNRFIPE